MTSFWRHSRLTYYDLGPNFLTQGVELLPGEVWQVSKRNSQYFRSYLRKTTGGLCPPPPPAGRGLDVSVRSRGAGVWLWRRQQVSTTEFSKLWRIFWREVITQAACLEAQNSDLFILLIVDHLRWETSSYMQLQLQLHPAEFKFIWN